MAKDLISNIHNEEIPSDEYYVELDARLKAMFPNTTVFEREHVVALAAAFEGW